MADAGENRVVETERLLLRPHRLEDYEALCALWSEPAAIKYTSGVRLSAEDCWSRLMRYAGQWSLLGLGYWAVWEKETGRFVGDVGLSDFRRELPHVETFNTSPEVGWVLSSAMHGKGYATEAVNAALNWGETHLNARRFVALIHDENAASFNVAAKTGFKPFARTRYRDSPVTLLERVS